MSTTPKSEDRSASPSEVCDHAGTARSTRTAHGFLGDAPRGTTQILCDDCGLVLESLAPARRGVVTQ